MVICWTLAFLLLSLAISGNAAANDYSNCACTAKNLWLDIVIAIDVSAKTTNEKLVQVTDNIAELARKFTYDRSESRHVRLGIVTFAHDMEMVELNIASFDDLVNVLKKLKTTTTTDARLSSGLISSKELLRKSRANAPDVLILYSSSSSDESGDNEPTQIAQYIKGSETQIITVATSDDSKVQNLLEEIASSRMSFMLSNHDIVGNLVDILCQVNCFCPLKWHQLVVDGRKYGECFFFTKIDAHWKAASTTCKRLRPKSHLAYVNSEEKQKILEKLAVATYTELENKNPINYHIGLSYNEELGTYTWDSGEDDVSFSSWDANYPDLSKGKCVRAELNENSQVVWRNELCSKAASKTMCQTVACDTDNYCT